MFGYTSIISAILKRTSFWDSGVGLPFQNEYILKEKNSSWNIECWFQEARQNWKWQSCFDWKCIHLPKCNFPICRKILSDQNISFSWHVLRFHYTMGKYFVLKMYPSSGHMFVWIKPNKPAIDSYGGKHKLCIDIKFRYYFQCSRFWKAFYFNETNTTRNLAIYVAFLTSYIASILRETLLS